MTNIAVKSGSVVAPAVETPAAPKATATAIASRFPRSFDLAALRAIDTTGWTVDKNAAHIRRFSAALLAQQQAARWIGGRIGLADRVRKSIGKIEAENAALYRTLILPR